MTVAAFAGAALRPRSIAATRPAAPTPKSESLRRRMRPRQDGIRGGRAFVRLCFGRKVFFIVNPFVLPLSRYRVRDTATATATTSEPIVVSSTSSTSVHELDPLAHHQVDDDDEQDDDDGAGLDTHDQYVPWGANVVRSSMTRLAITTSARSSRRIRSATDSLRTSGLLGLFMN